jgi:hypothetical protein
MQTYGFHWIGYEGGEPKEPVIREYYFSDTETITKGDLVTLDTTGTVGEIDLAVSGDTAIIGVANETKSGTDSTTLMEVILDLQGKGRYAVYDANARAEGTELDIDGTTGVMTLAADSDSDVIVVSNSTATEPTIVRIHPRAYGLGIT